jgi:Ca2+-binding RTX toxin-like protein
MTISDDGGIDIINLQPSNLANNIDLSGATFSDVFGLKGNLVFGHNTVIEHVLLGGGADRVTGNNVNNHIYGGGSRDVLLGAGGNDLLFGEGGNDLIGGGGGHDRLIGGFGVDQLYGNKGNDLLLGEAGDDRLFGQQGYDILRGGDGNDFLSGGTWNDRLEGGNGNDALYGGEANDQLFGGDGVDVLHGGTGQDYLFGGMGADTFVFESAQAAGLGAGRDRVSDFEVNVDHIDLSAMNLSYTSQATFSGTLAEVMLVAVGVKTYVVGDTDADGNLDFSFYVSTLISESALVL